MGRLPAARELFQGDDEHGPAIKPQSTLARALFSITLADVSMSIDNVLAVASLARHNVELLVFGLVLSIALMGLGATLILRLMNRYPWISYVGVALLVYIGGHMMYEGWPSLLQLLANMGFPSVRRPAGDLNALLPAAAGGSRPHRSSNQPSSSEAIASGSR